MSQDHNLARIHLLVPPETKARWVRASRHRNQRLGEMIVEMVDNQVADGLVWCELCERNVAPIIHADDHLCPKCNLVL